MASVERKPLTGVWGRSPERGPGAEPLVRDSGAKPPEAGDIFILRLHFLRSSCGILYCCSGCKFLKIFNTRKIAQKATITTAQIANYRSTFSIYNCTNQHQLHTKISLASNGSVRPLLKNVR